MIWIELIGPSGVGKSYWYQKFMEKYPEYEPRQMVLDRIYESEDFNKASLRIKFMFRIYKMNLYRISNHFKHKLFNYFLDGFDRKSKSIFTQKDDIIIRKYLESVDALNEPQIVVLKKIAYFHQKLIEFKFYKNYLKEFDFYIAEDGLMHLSSVLIEELKADKILVFEKEYKEILAQRLDRARNRPTTYIEFLLNKEQLNRYVENYYQHYASKIKTILQECESQKVKIINLDEEDVTSEMYQSLQQLRNNS